MKDSIIKRTELFSFISFFVSSLSFAFFDCIDYQGVGISLVLGYILPALFWIGIIIGVAFQIVISTKLKITRKKHGVISFFKNKVAVVVDIIAILSLIISIFIIVLDANHKIAFIIFSIFIFSFEMHCITNGKNFIYLINEGDNADV